MLKKVIHRKARFCEQLFQNAQSLINKGFQRFYEVQKRKVDGKLSPRGEGQHFVKYSFYEMLKPVNKLKEEFI